MLVMKLLSCSFKTDHSKLFLGDARARNLQTLSLPCQLASLGSANRGCQRELGQEEGADLSYSWEIASGSRAQLLPPSNGSLFQ